MMSNKALFFCILCFFVAIDCIVLDVMYNSVIFLICSFVASIIIILIGYGTSHTKRNSTLTYSGPRNEELEEAYANFMRLVEEHNLSDEEIKDLLITVAKARKMKVTVFDSGHDICCTFERKK